MDRILSSQNHVFVHQSQLGCIFFGEFFFTDSTMVNQIFSPPFGEYVFHFFPSTLSTINLNFLQSCFCGIMASLELFQVIFVP